MITIFLEYFYWHFTIAPFEILRIMNNYLISNWHKFLVVQHFKTLFSPWHRQNPSDFGKRANTFTDKIFDALADLYIRLIAAGVRSAIILAGLIVELLTLIGFLLIFVIWLAWPVIAIYLIIMGFNIIYGI
jgi:hypothetical protein